MRRFSLEEVPDSRSSREQPPEVTLKYLASGEQNDYLVKAIANLQIPREIVSGSMGTLVRQDLQLDPAGFEQYLITAPYGRPQAGSLVAGSSTFSFDTTGGTVRVEVGRRHAGSFPPDASNPDPFKAAIGVKPDGTVEGVELASPALKISYDFKHPSGVVNELFARRLSQATGHTNAYPFRSFAAGELLFLGSTGRDGSEIEAEVTYHFACSANVSDLSFGDIDGILKEGHHYAWVEYEVLDVSGNQVTRPKRVHVEQVYGAVDFAAAFGWS